ncbi:MaoC family dehydratase [Solwaraspora sp. WMMD406]|uniref:MaoC family dehydratase n=1 Tax=Solwaraspora sp. WMMD406 TaxID=3016095 RepID=UPI00241643B6|nr:MaoC family dehydratase [Solwaraspora sp. WMMD406]MDG4765752.1 MaoC family dehydratase [Solwaraspora sp. WMMD406]
MAFDSIDALRRAAGTSLGPGEWIEVDQDRIDGFATAAGDHQLIHVDPDRAADRQSGGTVAPGFLTLSLLPALVAGRVAVSGARMSVNYGLNRVRFPAPVPAGSRLRAVVDVLDVTDVAGGVQVRYQVTVERDRDGGGPVCVAECLTRVYV